MKKRFIWAVGGLLGIVLLFLAYGSLMDSRDKQTREEIGYLEEASEDIHRDVCGGGDVEQAISQMNDIESAIIRNAREFNSPHESFVFEKLYSVTIRRQAIERFQLDGDIEALCRSV